MKSERALNNPYLGALLLTGRLCASSFCSSFLEINILLDLTRIIAINVLHFLMPMLRCDTHTRTYVPYARGKINPRLYINFSRLRVTHSLRSLARNIRDYTFPYQKQFPCYNISSDCVYFLISYPPPVRINPFRHGL